MKRWLLFAARQPELVWMSVLASVLLFGCASAEVQARRATIVGSHAEQLAECRKLTPEAAYVACKDAVNERFGLRPVMDGGVR